jgi:hypothetical protein
VSLNGATLGPANLYMWRLDGKAVTAVDLATGQPRWSRDITDLPDSISDLGTGVVVVSTRLPAADGTYPAALTITLVRADSGQQIARTAGDSYEPSADGRLLLVFSRRTQNPDSCAAPENNCEDVTAWDVRTGAVAWRLSLGPNAGYIVDGQLDALASIDRDGTVRSRDVSTGAVAGSKTLSPEVVNSPAQVGLLHDAFLIAQRGRGGITVTAYERPSLSRRWSVMVPDRTPTDGQGDGYLYLWACGPDACMTVNGGNTWVINDSTGSVRATISRQVIQRLGSGVFLATPLSPLFPSDSPAVPVIGFIVDPDGQTQATLTANALVDWSDNGDRALVTVEGPQRTEFRVIDDRGTVRSLGSVPGTLLTCHARADTLACADPRGTLRVWRLPL